MSDTQLIQQYLKKGDQGALEILVNRHLAGVFALVRRFTGDADTASDITQEAFVKAWKHLKRFDQTKSFRTWLFVIAKRTALDELKKKKALPFSLLAQDGEDVAESIADPAPSVVELLSGQATTQELALALAHLPADHRQVVDLHVEEDLTFREIAEIVKKPLHTVKSQYRRGMALLKKVLTVS